MLFKRIFQLFALKVPLHHFLSVSI